MAGEYDPSNPSLEPGVPGGVPSPTPLVKPNVTGAGDDPSPPKPPRKPRDNTKWGSLDVIHGHAKIKAFPVTINELITLGALGFAASVFFSIGAGAVGFSLDVFKDLDMAKDLDPVIRTKWEVYRTNAICVAIGSYVIGLLLAGIGAINIVGIIRRTKFAKDV